MKKNLIHKIFLMLLITGVLIPSVILAVNNPGVVTTPNPGVITTPNPGVVTTPNAGVVTNTNSNFTTLKNPLKSTIGNNVWNLIDVALNLLLTIASIGAVLYVMYVGFEYITARGDEKKISEVHQKFLWGAVGIGVIFSAKVIAEIIGKTIDSLK